MVVVGVVGVVVIAVAVAVVFGRARRRRSRRSAIDPFTLSEPWRRHVSAAQSAVRRFEATVRSARPGPLHDRLGELAVRLEHGLEECWQIARRGDEIDATLARLKVGETRRRLAGFDDGTEESSPERQAMIESLRAQVAAADRLRSISDETAAQLRLTQIRLDQLVTAAAEVVAATLDPASLDTGVAELVTELEALRLAIDETASGGRGAEP